MNNTKTIFVTYAVKEEYIPLTSPNYTVIPIYTGVGKTKSAAILTKNICQHKPDFVLNVGTAGTLHHSIGDIFIVKRFVDRDYEAIKLPGIGYEIDGIELLGSGSLKDWAMKYDKQGVCSTGDTFVTKVNTFCGDIIDMEAYSQAYVCKELNIPFLSIKYITDIVGQNSVEQWENKLAEARTELSSWFEKHELLIPENL